MQAFFPFGIWIGVGGDPAANPEHRATSGIEFDGADRDVELEPATGEAKPMVPQYIPRRFCSHCEINWRLAVWVSQ